MNAKRSCLLLLALAAGPVQAQTLAEKVASVLPSAEEDRWLDIPWRTSIAEARQEAEKQKKPILLWVMNGNPLGCA